MLHQDTVAGIALLIVCALVYWLTTGFSEPPSMLSQNVPPTFFPRLVIAAIAVLSISLILAGLRKEAVAPGAINGAVWVTALIVVLAGLAAALIGTLLALAALAAVLPVCWGERRWRLIVPVAIGLPAAIYLLFGILLDVRFPAGLLFESIV